MKKTNKTTLLFIASALAGVTALAGVGTLLDVKEASANGTSVFEMIDGAGLRTSDPTGLRFKAKMTKDYYQQITTTNKDLYIAVIPYTYYTAYQSADTDLALYPWLVQTYGASKILNLSIPDEKIYSATVDGASYYCANAVISNIRLNNYHLDFVGVAYITDGATYTDAGAVLEEDNARSVFEVAVKAYEDNEDRALYKDFLEDTIEKGMYNAYGVKQDSATGKYVYNGTAYDTFEEATTVVNVEDMTLTLEDATVCEGNAKQLNAVMSFGDGQEFGKEMYYTWASSNPSVATVDENGVVTAKAVGTTEITASVLNGKYTATATLTVEAKPVVTVAEGVAFMAKSNGGKWSYETGAATINLDGVDFNLNEVEKVLVNGNEVAFAVNSATEMTLTNAPGGDQLYTFVTPEANYVVGGCIYANGISTVAELEEWRTTESYWYTVLLNDIDYEGATLAVGANVLGTLDGRGYQIKNFTYTQGFVKNLFAKESIVKNVYFAGATQDCTGMGKYPTYGLLGQWTNGTLENLYLDVTTTNLVEGAEHIATICYGLEATAKATNVVLDLKNANGNFHYGINQNNGATVSGIVGGYEGANGSSEGGGAAWGVNGGFHQKLSWMIAEEANDELLGYTSSYWAINTTARTIALQPWETVRLKKTVVNVENTIMAKAPESKWTREISGAQADFSAVNADFSAIQSVTIDGEAFTSYTVSGSVLTLNNIAGGDHDIVITTESHVYNASICAYRLGISTVDELNAWRTTEQYQYAVLLNDIDYEGATLGAAGNILSVLDGRGYSISNFTTTNGFVNRLYDAQSAIKNVAFYGVTQDCSGWSGGVDRGVLGQWNNGTLENVYLQVHTINVVKEHYGVLCFGMDTGSKIHNVVVDITSEGTLFHYVMMHDYALAAGDSSGVVGAYANGSTESAESAWGTNSGFHQKLSWMIAEEANDELLGFTSEYWVIDTVARTITMQPKKKIVENTPDPEPEPEPEPEPLVKQTVNVEEVILAKGSGGRWNQATGAAPVDLSGVSADLSKIESVTLDGEEFTSYSASGAKLTLTDAVGGDHTLVITTETHIYNVQICVYAVSISTVDELEAWRTGEHWAYTVLLNDIDCGGATLGAATNNLCGILDGRGYTISNFTVTNGFIKNTYSSCGTTAGIKNLQLKNAVQDCSFTTGNGTTTGILGQHVYGVFENIYIEMSTVNAAVDHWGVLFYTANSGTIVKNVIINVTASDNNKFHYFMMTSNAATFENVYGVYANGKAMYGSPAWNTDGCYEQVDWMLSSVPSIEAWGGYWQNTSTTVGLISLKDKIEKEEQNEVEDGYLVKDGKTAYKLLINDSDATMYGAAMTELRTLFKEATGIQLSIVLDDSVTFGANDKFISFGNTDALSLNGISTDASLGSQGYILKAVGDCIYIWSEGSDGATYAVYDLMNQLFNFEQYSERVYTLDKATTLQLPSIEEKAEKPDVEYRIAPTGVFTGNETALKRMRMVKNGTGIITGGGMHNVLTDIVPFDTYYSTNKTWFSSKTKSTDTATSTQLCYSAGGNTDSYNAMVRVAADNIIALLQKDKKNSIFAITQMDVKQKLCACSYCSGKNVADLQTNFVNDVTELVQVWLDAPDGGNGRKVQFATASYYETAVVPTVALNDNVSVWIAPISDNWAKAPDAEGNQMATLFNAWKQLAPGGVMLWAYNTYFSNYMTPFDSYDVLGDMLQFAVENGVYYFWAQGAWDSTASTAFESVKTYVLSKLMWDSALNVNDLIDDYFAGVYGTGTVAEKMRAAFDAVRTHMKDSGKTQGSIYDEPKPSQFFGYRDDIWDKTFLNSQLALFNDAINALGVKEGAVYDSIVCETISTRWMLKEYRSTSTTSYDGAAWGTWAEDIARLGFNRVSESTAF